MGQTTADICQYLDSFAPRTLGEDWDNIGFLVGDREQPAAVVMTCLTITPEVVEEAIKEQVQLIVSHHPLPFKGLKRITTDTPQGHMLLNIIRNGICIYSPHSAFDSTAGGINAQLAAIMELSEVGVLCPSLENPQVGAGRYGKSRPTSLAELATQLKHSLRATSIGYVGAAEQAVDKVGIACGSAGEFLGAASAKGCNTFVTGETSFHTCLAAKATGVGLILLGHFASERFAVETLAAKLQKEFANLRIFASQQDTDPITRV